MRKLLVRLAAVALILGCASPASAQTFEVVGIRAQGMGSAFVAVADDATATWWNPAGLATGKLFSLVGEHGEIANPAEPPDEGPALRNSVTGFSVAFPALAVSYYRLRISEIAPVFSTDPDSPDREDPGTGEVRLRSLAITQYGTTIGESLGSHFVIGSTLKILSAGVAVSSAPVGGDLLDRADDLDPDGDTETDLDIGAMAAFGRLRLGVTVKHVTTPAFGDGADRFEFKRQARAGVALMTQGFGAVQALTLAADMDLTRTETVNGDISHFATGLEMWFANRHLGLRSGFSLDTIGETTPTGSVGISVGGPSGLLLDAAYLFGSDEARKGLNIGVSMTF